MSAIGQLSIADIPPSTTPDFGLQKLGGPTRRVLAWAYSIKFAKRMACAMLD